MNKNVAEDIESVKESCFTRKFDEEANAPRVFMSLWRPHTERGSWLMRWVFPEL